MERRFVLLGKTGSGKSAAGNTILRGNHFTVRPSPVPVTRTCDMKEVGHIKVIDTPDMFNPSLSPDEMKREVAQCVELSLPGPHVFLLVIKLGRFTEEEENAVKWIQENFGEDASLHTIILFTHADQLEENTLKTFLAESAELRKLLHICGNQYHAFNNNNSDPAQVDDLMQKIDDLFTINGGSYCTYRVQSGESESESESEWESEWERERERERERKREREREREMEIYALGALVALWGASIGLIALLVAKESA